MFFFTPSPSDGPVMSTASMMMMMETIKVDERSGYYVPANNGVNPFRDPRNEL